MPPAATDVPMDLSMKSRRKLRLEEFLRQNLDEAPAGRVIEWVDRQKGVFRILWTHQSSGAFTQDDAALFRYWALARGKPANLSSVELKQSLRMALNKSPSVERIDMPHDEYRYFRFTGFKDVLSNALGFFVAWTPRDPTSFKATDAHFDQVSFKRTLPFDMPSANSKSRKFEDTEDAITEPRQLLRDLLTQPDPVLVRKTVSPSTSSSSMEDSSWRPSNENLGPYYTYEAIRDDPSPCSEHDDYLSRRVPSKDDLSPHPISLRTDLFKPTSQHDLYSLYHTTLESTPSFWERYRQYEPWTSYLSRDSCDSPYTVPSVSDGYRPFDHNRSLYTSAFPFMTTPHMR